MSAKGKYEWKDNRLIWVDLEMTGLAVDSCHILEMACIITDNSLNIVAEAPNLIIHHPEKVLQNMESWSQECHDKSGLTASSRSSNISLHSAEVQMLQFVQEHTLAGQCPLAGNTIHMDRAFLSRYMPEFTKHLHYRIVDVSTVKELCRRWFPEDFKNAPVKGCSHRALDDIKESIAELKYYKDVVFKR